MMTLNEIELEKNIASKDLLKDVSEKLDDDVLILGVSGKMGVNLALLLKNAIDEHELPYKIYGAARFSNEESKKKLDDYGIHTIRMNFLNTEDLSSLPKTKNVIFMVGHKFGTQGNESYTWAVNTYLPGKICELYPDSNIVAFSSGNVYPLSSVKVGAPSEEQSLGPIGEYAQSCLGRERIFEHFSKENGTNVTIFRLNYAIDLKYGVLSELGQSILNDEPIDLTMGQVNIISQKDACEMAIRSLFVAESPANVLNITGPETLSVKWLSERLAEKLDKDVRYTGEEQETALLNNASKSHKLFGYPKTTVREMIDYTSYWLLQGGQLADSPTHFQERKGRF